MSTREQFLAHFLAHQADVRAFIGSLILDRHLRQDIFQDVAMTLWQKFDEFDPNRPFGAWARGITARKILQHRHESQRFPAVFSPEAIMAILAAYDRSEAAATGQREALSECLRWLPTESRTLLELRYERDLRAEEIASLTNRTVHSVYQTLCRIRTRLAHCMRQRLALECEVIQGSL